MCLRQETLYSLAIDDELAQAVEIGVTVTFEFIQCTNHTPLAAIREKRFVTYRPEESC
jgi:hypothetical protein